MYSIKNYLFIPFILIMNVLTAQNYQAIHGSSFAGSLGAAANPAAIVHVPYAWDITPVSFQTKQATNAFKINNYSFLSSPGNATITAASGVLKRFLFTNQDVHLLNARIRLTEKATIAFGASVRNYVFATTSAVAWLDTTRSFTDFLKINTTNVPFSGESRGSSWVELYGTYARTVFNDGTRILNGGITLKVNRGIAGETAKVANLSYTAAADTGFLLASGSLQYGYSSNFDKITSTNSSSQNAKLFLQNTYASMSVDMGLEYILLENDEDADGGEYAYRTKIGISMMDVGRNEYRFGIKSRSLNSVKSGISDTLLEKKFSGINSFNGFNDTLATIAGGFSPVAGRFNIYQPTRLIINIDQHISDDFFVNAEFTFPVLSVIPKKFPYIKDMNLIAVTPRWETRSLGAYMPFLLNAKNQFWIGGAVKAGPLLLGIHNLANLFSKSKSANGGFYFALTFRPGKKHDGESNVAGDKLSAKERRRLDCPEF
jgi:hypothetical protein